jgi:ATP-dependent DNA helicase PIF1
MNTVIKGKAGTGKTALILELKSCLPADTTVFCATTARAALRFEGHTLHSWARVQKADGSVDELCDLIRRSGGVRAWKDAKTLVLDEMSMLSVTLFDKLENVARVVRESDLPFGGIQLVFVGDFAQLPPFEGKYCFEATSWGKCFGDNDKLSLTQVFRQLDSKFLEVLDELRQGQCSAASLPTLSSRVMTMEEIDSMVPAPPVLFPTNALASNRNEAKLAQLHGDVHTYIAEDERKFGCDHVDLSAAPDRLELKVGAKVVVIKNMKRLKLVNGSCGVVTRCTSGPNFARTLVMVI